MTRSDHTVGELAKLSGLTVRALHHYEKLGLLLPSGRSEAGYRLYAPRDVQVLHRIVAYQQMGLALKDIAPLLAPGGPPLKAVIERQIAAVEATLARQRRLLEMLRRVHQRAGSPQDDDATLAGSLLRVIAFSRHYDGVFSDDELARLRAAQDALGPGGIEQLRGEMRALVEAFRGFAARGLAPSAPEVAEAARGFVRLERRLNVDAALQDKVRSLAERSPGMVQAAGLTPAMAALIQAAIAAVKATGEPAAPSPDTTRPEPKRKAKAKSTPTTTTTTNRKARTS